MKANFENEICNPAFTLRLISVFSSDATFCIRKATQPSRPTNLQRQMHQKSLMIHWLLADPIAAFQSWPPQCSRCRREWTRLFSTKSPANMQGEKARGFCNLLLWSLSCFSYLSRTHSFFCLSCLGPLRSDLGSSPILANGPVEVTGSIWRGLSGESKGLASLGCDWMTAMFIKL